MTAQNNFNHIHKRIIAIDRLGSHSSKLSISLQSQSCMMSQEIKKLQKIPLDEIWIKVELIRRNQQVRYIHLSGQTSHSVIDQSMISIGL